MKINHLLCHAYNLPEAIQMRTCMVVLFYMLILGEVESKQRLMISAQLCWLLDVDCSHILLYCYLEHVPVLSRTDHTHLTALGFCSFCSYSIAIPSILRSQYMHRPPKTNIYIYIYIYIYYRYIYIMSMEGHLNYHYNS